MHALSNRKKLTRLARNLRPGDRFCIENLVQRGHWIMEVVKVQEACHGWFSGKRIWTVLSRIVDSNTNSLLPHSQDGYHTSSVYSTDKWEIWR